MDFTHYEIFIMTKFTLKYWEDDGWLVGRLVEVPGVFSQGETLEELKDNIKDAYTNFQCEAFNSIPQE